MRLSLLAMLALTGVAVETVMLGAQRVPPGTFPSRVDAARADAAFEIAAFELEIRSRHSDAVPTPPTISLLSFIRPIMSILIIATVLASGTIG